MSIVGDHPDVRAALGEAVDLSEDIGASHVVTTAKRAGFKLDRAGARELIQEYRANGGRGTLLPGAAEVEDSDAGTRRPHLYTVEELGDLPPLEMLVDGMFTMGGLAVAFAPPESFKTFLYGIDLPLCVASGARFHGRAIHSPGPAVLVSGEGRAGLAARVAAWREHRGWAATVPMFFRLEPVNLMEASQVVAFAADLEELEGAPRLIVFDTLARCTIGGDENSAGDMGTAIRNADYLREETGATVLLIHHSNASGERERGSSALRGAADTMISMKVEDEIIAVKCEKQKDAEPFDTFRLQPKRVGNSLILEGARASLHLTAPELTQSQRQLLDELHRLAPTEGLSTSKLEELTELERRTFYHAKKALLAKGYVATDREGRGALHTVTPKGMEALGAKVQEGATEGATVPGEGEVQEGGSTVRTPLAPSQATTGGKEL